MIRRAVILLVLFCKTTLSTRVTIENNGYKNILIALPQNTDEEERPRIVQSIEDVLRSSSILLQMSTKGRAYFSEASLLIPDNWKIADDDPLSWRRTSFNFTTNPRAVLTTDEADVIVTEKGQYPYVLHQSGCGKRGLRIILPKDFLFRGQDKGRVFTRLWSEYRYGVFPEGGFPNDDKYPLKYRSPGKKEEVDTECSDKTFWSSSLCRENDKKCEETSWTSSLMNQHLLSSAIMFCEGPVSLGPKHNVESPSKQNVLCQEEGTWFTVMKSPDFEYGKNAAPKYLPFAGDVSFQFVREAPAPRVTVAIEISSRMLVEKRYLLTQAAFYHFVYSTLPYGSEITLFIFGDEEGIQIAKETVILEGEHSRIIYMETQPLPEDASNTEIVSLADLFEKIFIVINVSEPESSNIIIVTTASHINTSTYTKVKQKVIETESRLHILLFPKNEELVENDAVPLWNLCSETGGDLISLHSDPIADLYRGFAKSVGGFNKDVQIMMSRVKEDTDANIEIPFVLDEELTQNLKVYLFFPLLDINSLQYTKTWLHTPSGVTLHFMKLEFLNAWVVDLNNAEAGKYILKTQRKEDFTAPVLLSVTGRSKSEEDPITTKAWIATTDFKYSQQIVPQPIQIFTEVRQGWHPVRGAQIGASLHHPDGKISELTLLDDGLGGVDITKDDGIYGRYFTGFTAPGYYNLYIKVSKGVDNAEILKGPNGFCCGSFFSAVTQQSVESFQRESGPVTFLVPNFETFTGEDRYPPSRVTDLKLVEKYDRICVLHWTAVGDDYDTGFAETYELKIFRDQSIVRYRFSESRQEVYSETILTTPEAVYGTNLNHAFELPKNIAGGIYYMAIRAIDGAGNAGEPSNSVPVLVEEESPAIIECENKEENCGKGDCKAAMPSAEKLIGANAAHSVGSYIIKICFVPSKILIPIFSLIFSLFIINIF